MRVTVDPTSCELNALCVDTAPEVFRLVDDEVVQIASAEPSAEHEEAVRYAAVLCPKQALRIVESADE